MMSIGPFTSVKWTAFEFLKSNYLKLHPKKEKLSFVENFLLGGCSGCIAVSSNFYFILYLDDYYLSIEFNFTKNDGKCHEPKHLKKEC